MATKTSWHRYGTIERNYVTVTICIDERSMTGRFTFFDVLRWTELCGQGPRARYGTTALLAATSSFNGRLNHWRNGESTIRQAYIWPLWSLHYRPRRSSSQMRPVATGGVTRTVCVCWSRPRVLQSGWTDRPADRAIDSRGVGTMC